MRINVLKFKKIDIKNILLLINVIILLISTSFLFKYYLIDNYFSDLGFEVAKEIYEGNDKEQTNFLQKLKPLIDINPDIVGWLDIDGTLVSYPVMQPDKDDPLFYLDHDYIKKSNINGSVFINPLNKFNERTKNIVVHAHNLKNGKMFATLLQYDNIQFFKKCPIIIFNTIFGFKKFKVFSIFKTNTDKKHGKIFNYLVPDFKNVKDFLIFLYNLKIRSLLDIPVKLNANDKLLTLSTCSSEMPDFRTVVVAREIREDESEFIDLELVKKSENPLWPKAWYELKKIPVPKVQNFFSELKDGKITWLG